MNAAQVARLRLLVDGADQPAACVLLFTLRACLLRLCAGRRNLLLHLLHLLCHMREPLPRLGDQLRTLRLQLRGLLCLLLAGLQAAAALGLLLLDLLDLLSHLARLLAEEFRLRLRHLHDLADLRELLLQGHKLCLLRLLEGPQLLRLALEALVDLLQFLPQARLVALCALELLLAGRRLLPQPFRVRHELLGRLHLLLRRQIELLDLLLLERYVLRQLHIQTLKLLEVCGLLVHLGLDLAVVLEVGVVLGLDGLDLLLKDLHSFAVLLHMGLQDLVFFLQAGEARVAAERLCLRYEGLQLQPLRLRVDPGLRLAARTVEAFALALRDAQAVQLLLPLLRQLLDNALGLLDGLHVAVGADDVLEVLEQAILVG
mmetsp:Transcript_90048/g.268618  ORF Transcript_90048/g.268618 Transcript_90048/m.268618 type:complete len:373 (-) Transcript_90048:38-1156(-)